ncbi:hypothetical protein GCM10028798_06680 [Humibacter antri]
MTLLVPDLPAEYAPPPVRSVRPVIDEGSDAAVERARTDLERLLSLRSRMGELESTRVDDGVLRTDPALAPLLPGGGLQPGGVYSVQGTTSLVMALLAGPSAEGAWSAVVGMPGFGAEAAARLGVDLDRLVLVPHPGDRWLSVTAALADAVSVIVAVPGARVGEAEAARLAARLRQRRAVLLVCGAWPRVDALVGVASTRWAGIGEGHGYLAERELTVAVKSRSWGRERRANLLLTPDGRLHETTPSRQAIPSSEGLRALKAVV